jgi:translation elongation factor P/translation initiation factor 5A
VRVFFEKGKKSVLILKNSENDPEKNGDIRKTKHKSINSNNPSTKSLTSNHEPGKNIGC